MLSQDLIFSLLLLLTILVALPITTATSPGIFFTDWDGLQTCSPLSYSTPYTEQHIIDIIYHTKLRNETLKVIGTGHSFSGVQLTKGHMMSLDHYSEVVARTDLTATDGTATDGTATDGTTGHMYSLVEVQAGIRLRDFNNELEKMGLSMLNLGATAAQSVAGATATGTHGTGTKLGSISTQISAMRLIDSFGKVHVLSEHDENTDMFEAARVGIGALGAISTMTFKVVPLFKLRRRNIAYELPTLLKELPVLLQQYERLQWYFTPYTTSATLVLREETSEPISPIPTSDDPGGCWSSQAEAQKDCTDVSYKAMTDSLSGYESRTIYTEMEMFIPVEHTEAAILDFLAFMERVKPQHNPMVELFTGVRYVKADSILLSPMYQRDSSVISFIVMGNKNHTGSPEEFEMYASGLEEICETKYNGRPHWGKVNYATHKYLESEYGASLETFNEVRKAMDPDRMFSNEYLDSRL